jgi:hypothetical protein
VPGDDDTMLVVLMGRNAWPMPIPLVRSAEGWHFDTEAGLEEMVDRRIGANELAAIGYARTYVQAQVEYAGADRDGDQVLEYAQKLVSTPGRQDGLYWPDPAGDAPSPLGPLAASEEDYTAFREAEESFHGYYYRVLTGQGPNPPGGAYDYVINGNMIAGFALVAWPADYGNSGIMTFVVSHQGKVYQKDLGESTADLGRAMTVYDPDETWEEVLDTGA